jgi:hypothetical protein
MLIRLACGGVEAQDQGLKEQQAFLRGGWRSWAHAASKERRKYANVRKRQPTAANQHWLLW